jgi:hypothetical protein
MSLGKLVVPWGDLARGANCAALAYIMVRPVGFNQILLPVLALLAVMSVATVVIRRPKPSRPILTLFAALISAGLYGALVGLGNPGLLNGLLVWLVAPIVFGSWLLAGDARQLKWLLTTGAVTTTAISVVILLFIAGSVGAMPQVFPVWLQTQLGFFFDPTITDGVAIQFLGLSTLVAAAPMWLTATILPGHPLLPHRALSASAGVAALVATMVAGRAALTVVTLIVPAIVWIGWRIISRRERRSVLRTVAPLASLLGAGAVAAALLLTGNANVTKAFGRLLSLFTGEGLTVSDRIRSAQSGELLDAWTQSPVFGHGLGATIDGYSRSDERPWDFELQYHLYLFQFGIVGVVILLVAVSAGIYAFVKAVKTSPDSIPVLFVVAAGGIAMLVANASNPYLQAPGHMWAVYLPLMASNLVLASGSLGKSSLAKSPDTEAQNHSLDAPVGGALFKKAQTPDDAVDARLLE